MPGFATEDDTYVPAQLGEWVPWVLDKHPEQSCPFQSTGGYRLCQAPSSLRLSLDDAGGTFALTGYAFKDGWVALPGDPLHWPQEVARDGKPVATGGPQDRPSVWLSAGPYTLNGRFVWSRLPELLYIPDQTALIDLSVNGTPQPRIGRPQPDRIWVGRQATEGPQAEADRLSLSVFRKLTDGVPMDVTTVYRIEVAGAQREVKLPAPLLDGFTPTQVDSQLPLRLDPDGTFQLQVRPGLWDVTVTGRSHAAVDKLVAPVFAREAHWPASEIWVFDARPAIRLVELSGAPSIDPTQVPLPQGWGGMPTFRLTPSGELLFTVKRRGDPEPEANQLNLERTVWLDFDGEGYTVRDQISGTVSRDWRLDALTSNQLGYLELNGKPQLITRLAAEGPPGVEVRQGSIRLIAESRTEKSRGGFAVLGWAQPFQSVTARLNLPPGWQVFSVSGVDNLPNSWLQRWTLFDLFLVLVTSVAAARLWGWRWGALFLVTLTLLWHEAGAPQWTWINLIAAIALLRVVGDVKRLRRSLEVYRALTAVVLVLLLLPFSVNQIRTAFYPQLEHPYQPIQGYAVPSSAPVPPQAGLAPPEEAATRERSADLAAPATPGMTARVKQAPGLLSSAPYRYALESFDPQAKLQTGPGLPQWQWNSLQLSWNGPVQPEQIVEIVYLSPWVNSILNGLRVALALLLAWHLLRGIIPGQSRKPDASGTGRTALPVLACVLLLPVLVLSQPPQARADYPPAGLLNELEQRLLQPPRCLPDCASIPRARLSVSDTDVLQLRLDLHVSERIGAPLPGRAGHWEPSVVTVDGEVPPLTRAPDGTLYVVLAPGVHSLVMQGTVSGANAVQLHFPLLPRQLEADIEGWDVSGFREPGVPAQQIQLTRLKPEDHKEVTWEPVTVPPFVTLDRTFRIGLDWEIDQQLTRVTPPGKSVVLRVPLLPGEAVLTEGVPVKNGFAEVTLGPQASSFQWQSRLDKQAALVLTAADTDAWVEVWRFAVSPVWHVDYTGIAPVHHTDRASRWSPLWQPWPGETLTAAFERPDGIPGPTDTVQASSLVVKPGQRAADADLTLSVRSSQGAKRRLRIPAGADLLSVTIDGQAQPIRQEDGEVILPLRPGTQRIDIKWRTADAVTTLTRTPAIDLGGPHVNASLQMSLGYDRWILWTGGPAMGPAVLFWGVVIVIALVAAVLGRIHLTPLKTWQWALLGLGLSQVALPLAALVVAWFFVVAYRGRGTMPEDALQFNAIQVGLALMTLIVIGAIIAGVQQGLLGWPNMLVSGNQSSAYQFNWYQDRWGSGYPQAWVISVPMIVYRLLMLAWALWLAFASVSWLRWGWQQYTVGGLYRPRMRRASKAGKRDGAAQTPVSDRDAQTPGGPTQSDAPL
jgi:hypothetical protein